MLGVCRKRVAMATLALLSNLLPEPRLLAQDRPAPAAHAPHSTPLVVTKESDTKGVRNLGVMDPVTVELQILRARQSASGARDSLEQELLQGLSSVDPIWGGAYVSALDEDRSRHVVAKSLMDQARGILVYTRAAFAFGNPRYLDVAVKIAEFSLNNLSAPKGGFYGAQQIVVGRGFSAAEYLILPDVQRRDIAAPTVIFETPINANARIVEALAELYASTLDKRFLTASQETLAWLKSRASFAMREGVSDMPLDDRAYVGAAELSVYAVAAQRERLARAVELFSEVAKRVLAMERRPIMLSDRLQVARQLNLAYRYSGRPDFQRAAEQLRREASRGREGEIGEELSSEELLSAELGTPPLRITVVGAREDQRARELWMASLSCDVPYRRQEWISPGEKALMNPDKEFPVLHRPAAFICSSDRCSVALFTEAEVREKIREMFPPL